MDDINQKANALLHKIKHFLIARFGKLEHEASLEEFYQAFAMVLRDEIMINWAATLHSFDYAECRILYYISMEYLPGKLIKNNITNIGAHEVVQALLTKTNRNLDNLLAYDMDPGLGNGGLGRLASCFLDSLATQNYPAYGYGLRYQYGIFEQEIWNGMQVERPDCWLLYESPWECRKDVYAQSVYFRGTPIPATNSHGDEVYHLEDYKEVRAIPFDIPIIGYPLNRDYSVISLRLWTTKESPRNFQLQRYNAGQLGEAGENTSLTDVLYPNDNHEIGKRIRLKQEFLLVCASVQDIIKSHLRKYGDLQRFADKTQIQINDTHPALIIAELTRRLTKNHDIPWKRAWEITQSVCNYTNHTILKESLEEWNEDRVATLLPRQYRIIQKLNDELCTVGRNKLGDNEERIKKISIIENGQIKMANLAIFGSHKINGVAKLHTDILKSKIFNDLFQMFPEKFVHITNGITPRRWLLNCNPLLANFITERIGSGWIYNFTEISNLAKFGSDRESQEKFLEIKRQNKKRMLDFLSKDNPVRDHKGKIVDHSHIIDSDALIDMQIKRIHEYKRQLLKALHLIMQYKRIKKNPKSAKIKRMVIIGGKAAPGYDIAKKIILLIFCIIRKINSDEEVGKYLKAAFVENYNVSKAEILIPSADLSEQISTAGMEASGTGNMKLAINGALTIGTQDGANIEMREAITDKWWPFSFGSTAEEIAEMKEKKIHPAWDIYINNEEIRHAVESLKDGTFIKSEAEHTALSHLHDIVINGARSVNADPYFVLKDLQEYDTVQEKVEQLYLDKYRWAEFAIHNIAGMGRFSSDEVINNYAQSIWNLEKCSLNKEILEQMKKEYADYICL